MLLNKILQSEDEVDVGPDIQEYRVTQKPRPLVQGRAGGVQQSVWIRLEIKTLVFYQRLLSLQKRLGMNRTMVILITFIHPILRLTTIL